LHLPAPHDCVTGMKHFAALCVLLMASMSTDGTAAGRFALVNDPEGGRLRVLLDGREAFVYEYGESLDLPHYFPLNTPGGRNLLVQKTDPYPHHRAFWFGDTVKREGTSASLYNAYYSGAKLGELKHGPPFDSAVRHVEFEETTASGGMALIRERLVWETNRTKSAFPLLDEQRDVKVQALEQGYLMDVTFTVTATYGDVRFISDPVHYAWPYLRLDPRFSGTSGAVITSDSGATGEKATNMQFAKWIDYSNTVDGEREGIAVFQWPDGEEHRWLTREYGTFGPRRPDAQSGKPFDLKEGESLTQRVGVFVHRGDVETGRVAEVYARWAAGD
jgi:hypothetical protein